jgi:ankyrin repeat protein
MSPVDDFHREKEAPEDAFLDAVMRGDIARASSLIRQGVSPNELTEDGDRPLIMAVSNLKPRMAKALLDWGADVNGRDVFGGAALHYAADRNDTEAIAFLLAAGADINAQNHNGYTPLMTAATRLGGEEAVKALLDAGADPDIKNNQGRAALHMAAGHSVKIIHLLAEAGAHMYSADNNGVTVEYIAEKSGMGQVFRKIRDDVLEKELSVYKNGLSRPLKAPKPLKGGMKP